MIEILAQVTGVHRGKPFCAGLVLWDNRVVEASPILRLRFKGQSRNYIRAYCQEHGWTVEVVHELTRSRAG